MPTAAITSEVAAKIANSSMLKRRCEMLSSTTWSMAYTSCTGWSLSIAQTLRGYGRRHAQRIARGPHDQRKVGKLAAGREEHLGPRRAIQAQLARVGDHPDHDAPPGVRTAVDHRMEHLTERVLLWPQLARQAFVDDDFGRVRLLSFRPRKAAPRDQAHTHGRDVLVADIAGIRHRFLSVEGQPVPERGQEPVADT